LFFVVKAALLLLAIVFTSSPSSAKDIAWTHSTVEGEDASSAHYYFYRSDGPTFSRVRWVWNGGAQNAPTVTDYLMEGNQLTVLQRTGSRKEIPKLIAGREAKLDLKQKFTLLIEGRDETLALQPGQSLTEAQQTAFRNFKALLSNYRERGTAD
jgi:hypothetical protein